MSALSWINRKKWTTWRKKYLISNDYRLGKVLAKIKETISIEKFDETKILIDANGELPQEFTWKNVVLLMTCIKQKWV